MVAEISQPTRLAHSAECRISQFAPTALEFAFREPFVSHCAGNGWGADFHARHQQNAGLSADGRTGINTIEPAC